MIKTKRKKEKFSKNRTKYSEASLSKPGSPKQSHSALSSEAISRVQSRNSFQKIHNLHEIKIQDPLTHTATINNQIDLPENDL